MLEKVTILRRKMMSKAFVNNLRITLVTLAVLAIVCVPQKTWGLLRAGLFFDVGETQNLIQNPIPFEDAVKRVMKVNLEMGFSLPLPLITPSLILGGFFDTGYNHTSVYGGVALTTQPIAGVFLDVSLGLIFNDRRAPISLSNNNIAIETVQCALPLHVMGSVGYEFLGENFPVGQSIMLTWSGVFKAPFCDEATGFVDGIFGSQSIGIRYDISF